MGEGRNKLTRKIEYKANNSKGAVQETPSLSSIIQAYLYCASLYGASQMLLLFCLKKKK